MLEIYKIWTRFTYNKYRLCTQLEIFNVGFCLIIASFSALKKKNPYLKSLILEALDFFSGMPLSVGLSSLKCQTM